MTTFLFLSLGMIAVTLIQIDVAYYRYLKSRTSLSDTIRVDVMFNSPRRNFLRAVFTLMGLGLLFLSGRSCLENTPAQFPLILSIIGGFILWVMLLQISIKLLLSPDRRLTASALSLAFVLPLVLIGLASAIAYMLPELAYDINNFHTLYKYL